MKPLSRLRKWIKALESLTKDYNFNEWVCSPCKSKVAIALREMREVEKEWKKNAKKNKQKTV